MRAQAGEAMNPYQPLVPLPGAELIEWLALRRVCGGGMAMVGARWCDLGRLVPSYLHDPLEDLHRAGLVVVAGVDEWGRRRAAVTLAGRARFVELSAKRAAPIEPRARRGPPGWDVRPSCRRPAALDVAPRALPATSSVF
ncbi:MAG: hypothetical protein ACRDUV_13355 [Pseudonocardiaceae bacterium]